MNRKLRHASLLALLLLAACGSQPPLPVTTSATPPAKPKPTSLRKPNVVQKRGGAYYKDDGPGENIPENLDDIPDAQPRVETLHRFANNPYVVLGKSYTPETTLKPYKQRGIASWYGKKFHGQKTSIGEPYDMFAMTAAHPTLAIPSYARVTNVATGQSVVVRVTDRGPFHADRIMDLSYAAAYRLGYVNNGSMLVEVEAILPDDASMLAFAQAKPLTASPTKTPLTEAARDELDMLATKLALSDTATPSPAAVPTTQAQPLQKGIFLQLGAFSNADNAESLRLHLARELDWLNEGIQVNAGNGMHRVHLGPYTNRSDAEKIAEKIRLALGYKPSYVTR